MSAIPGDIEPVQQPPMTLPLRHFIVAGGFLLVGLLAAVGVAIGAHPQLALVHVHLLLAGWVCVTIMGAMTQFVPVWSGAELHSERLAAVQLPLVGLGLLGFAASLLAGAPEALPTAGSLMLVGFWTFVYNIGRTLATVDDYDVTERHFALALGFFLLVTTFGFLLAVDFSRPVISGLPVTRANVVDSHATLAVFGAVLTTVLGALYQLATMFTQTELHGVDLLLKRFEAVVYPIGVLLLASGRLVDAAVVAAIGGLLVTLSLVGFCVILARRLFESRVDWTPMLSRYAIGTAALALWALFALSHWITSPLDGAAVFGAPGTTHLLVLGAIGFIVLGTLYHIVPFIIWVHRYSDLLGLEPVPMIDDLYDDRLAAADFGCLFAGTGVLVADGWVGLPETATVTGGLLVLLGACIFCVNLLGVIREHSPDSVSAVLFGTSRQRSGNESEQPTRRADDD